MRSRHAVLASTSAFAAGVITFACGLTVEGSNDSEPSGDSGTDRELVLEAATPSEASGVSPTDTYCVRLRASDPTVKRCIDHDEIATQIAPSFGFDFLTSTTDDPARIAELAPSPLGVTGGQALRLGFNDVKVKHDVVAYIPALTQDEYKAAKSISLDVDVIVDEMNTTYVALAAFHLVGAQCTDFLGFAINQESFVRPAEPSGLQVAKFTVGQAYHLRVVGHPNESPSDEELFIDGASIGAFRHFYSPSCDFAKTNIGAYFTDASGGKVTARYDQVVVRVTN